MSQGINKIAAERNQKALLDLISQPGNDTCADCKSRQPRWTSHNFGIFICVNCASIHRKMGTHISKVKSATLDTWSKEQVEVMRQNGNLKSNALYNPDEVRHPPPTNMMESERDSELEKYIRDKYQHKRFINKSAFVASQLGPSRTAPSQVSPRPRSTPLGNPSVPATSGYSASGPFPSSTTQAALKNYPSTLTAASGSAQVRPTRSVSQPLTSMTQLSSAPPPPLKPSSNPVWDDLISLQVPSQSSSLPLQFQPTAPSLNISSTQPITIPHTQANLATNTNPYGNVSISPGYPQMLPNSSPAYGGGSFGAGGMNPGPNPFQQQQPFQVASSSVQPMLTPGTSFVTNPFNQMGGMAMGQPVQQQSFQPSSFGQSQFFSQPPSMQPQPTGQSYFQPTPQNPGQSPFMNISPLPGTPSPLPQQPSPFPPQQSAPTQNNPFGTWQQGQQGGYFGQQWGGM